MQFRTLGAIDATRVMARRQRLAAEVLGERHQVAELHRLVAADAGHRGLATGIGVGEVADHLAPEHLLAVQHVVRDAKAVGDVARIMDVLAGAAGTLLLDGRAVVVELQGGADDVVALLGQQAGDDG
mgnify:CR=1 FL=1